MKKLRDIKALEQQKQQLETPYTMREPTVPQAQDEFHQIQHDLANGIDEAVDTSEKEKAHLMVSSLPIWMLCSERTRYPC